MVGFASTVMHGRPMGMESPRLQRGGPTPEVVALSHGSVDFAEHQQASGDAASSAGDHVAGSHDDESTIVETSRHQWDIVKCLAFTHYMSTEVSGSGGQYYSNSCRA